MSRNIALMPWIRFFQNALFWQATWFLYFQNELSAADALLLYVIYDLAVTAFEAPSGYLSDRLGRRGTLILSAIAMCLGTGLLTIGGAFWVFAMGQAFYGIGMACVSGTDTALVFESLESEGRGDEIEAVSLRLFRFGFAALALSSVVGGALALLSAQLPFLASTAAFGALTLLMLRLKEPPSTQATRATMTERARFRSLLQSLRAPLLKWLLAIGVLFYGFSHLPFVYGQPFIRATMEQAGYGGNTAPLVAGIVTAIMMILSILVSYAAPKVRKTFGLTGALLLAMTVLVIIPAGLALSGSILAIALLLLRKVPDSFSVAMQSAAVQPLVKNETRATFLSLQSFLGKLLFGASLWVASFATVEVGEMPLADIRYILSWYAAAGCLFLVMLLVTARIPRHSD